MTLIDVIQVGALATNCYVVRSKNSARCIVIDPGGESQKIIDFLHRLELSPDRIISTHAHADHTGAVAPLLARYGDCEFAMGSADVKAASRQTPWLKNMLEDFEEPPVPAGQLNGGETLACDGFQINVLATPGHTSGSISLHIDGYVFTGDTLFRESIGRFDLADGDQAKEIESIRTVLFALDESTVVLPGHGPTTTIGHERTTNPYV
ncbi:MAG: MBL fold metallo-hydrolase [Chloroflexi bacterium]|nr:MBL fold metallo-hydrolase [Chloroflexota bacterium]